MGKFGKQLQKTLHKVQDKFAPHNGYVKLEDEDALPSDVPEGSFVVYVGDEMRRFVIQTKILNHYLFRELLEKSAEEFGYNPDRGLIMDCDVPFFKHLVRHIETSSPSVLEHRIAAGVFAAGVFGLYTNMTTYHTHWMDW